MGRGQELLDAARKGDGRTVTKILTLITKRSGPFTSLRRGAGVNVQDDNGYTPLHHACMNGHREIVHLLLSVDASPCVVDKKGATPLHLAAWKGDSTVVSMLLGHTNPPVNIDQKTNDQETALVIAAQFGFVDVVTRLIARGADVTLRNNKEESALDLAAQYGKLETVEQLLIACPQLIDPYRFPISRGRSFPTTPLHRAAMNGHKDVVRYLIDAGIDPNIRTDNGTALHEGVRYLSASVVRVLLSKGADLKAVDRQGHSVQSLLASYSEKATSKVERVIREYENKMRSAAYESEDEPLHAQDSPTGYVNTHGMIRVLPTLANNDASTNFNTVANSRLVSKNITLPRPNVKVNSYFLTKMNRSDSSINPNVNKALSEVQPSYVNHGYITEENPAKCDSSYAETLYGNVGHRMEVTNYNTSEKQIGQHDDLLYSNLERVNVAKELNGRMGSLNDSQNSLKKKPKPAPKPNSQTIQPPVICFDELLCISSKFRNENYPGNAGSNKVDSTVESDFKKTDDYVTVNNADDYVAIKQEDKYVVMKACSKENNNLVYDNLPDDEKAKRHGDTGSKSDYTPMHSDDVYIYMNRRSVPNMGYVQMTGNIVAEDTYISMNEETANKRRSVPHVRRLRGKCDGVHLKGAEGCIFNSADYAYTYMLKPEVEKDDLSPFIKKKMKMDQMPCFCHEEKSDIFYSCEDLYHIVSKNVIYNSLSDVPANCNEANAEKPITQDPDLANRSINDEYDLADKEFEPFKKEPNASTSSAEQTKGVTATKRFSKVIRKKLEQAKQLMTDW